jgi:hypothetical protein
VLAVQSQSDTSWLPLDSCLFQNATDQTSPQIFFRVRHRNVTTSIRMDKHMVRSLCAIQDPAIG